MKKAAPAGQGPCPVRGRAAGYLGGFLGSVSLGSESQGGAEGDQTPGGSLGDLPSDLNIFSPSYGLWLLV